jgi:hypothetical protein
MSSWVQCPCGIAIGNGAFPNSNVHRVISEEQYDRVEDPVDRRKLEMLFLAGHTLVRCTTCQRVLIQWAGESEFQAFAQEKPSGS